MADFLSLKYEVIWGVEDGRARMVAIRGKYLTPV